MRFDEALRRLTEPGDFAFRLRYSHTREFTFWKTGDDLVLREGKYDGSWFEFDIPGVNLTITPNKYAKTGEPRTMYLSIRNGNGETMFELDNAKAGLVVELI